MRILVVDDAMFMKKMLEGILTKHGHTIVGEASNGREALNEYKKHTPDLVTMDITMPEVDGIEGVKLIKAFDKDANIIMCSAMRQQAMVIDAIQAGAKDFIVKPFDEGRIISAISKIKV